MAINYSTRKHVNTQLSKKGFVPRKGLRKEYQGQSSNEEATERALVRQTTRGTLARTKKKRKKIERSASFTRLLFNSTLSVWLGSQSRQ